VFRRVRTDRWAPRVDSIGETSESKPSMNGRKGNVDVETEVSGHLGTSLGGALKPGPSGIRSEGGVTHDCRARAGQVQIDVGESAAAPTQHEMRAAFVLVVDGASQGSVRRKCQIRLGPPGPGFDSKQRHRGAVKPLVDPAETRLRG
jgi:hypothetical protein